MRLFIGTSIRETDALRIRSVAKDVLKDDRWRIAPVEQWHVTTLFIGERKERVIPAIQEEMQNIADRTRSIVLTNGRLYAIADREQRMLWIRFDPHAEFT